MTQVTGKIYPNGEFGIARVKKFTPDPPVDEPDRRKAELVKEYVQEIGIEAVLEAENSKNKSNPLGLSLLPKFTTRAERGSNGITRSSARLVRNSAYLLQECYGRNRLSFVTLTLPSITPEESAQAAEKWNRIVDNLREAIVYRLEKARLPKAMVGVTEIQLQRTEKTGVLGLHLHLLFVGRHAYKTWSIRTEELDSLWQKIVSNYLPNHHDFKSACSMEPIKKSAQGYLGKYMSKGVKDVAMVRETCTGMRLPKAWHTLTRGLLRWVKKRTVSESDIIHSLWEDCWSETPVLSSFHGFIEIKVSEDWHYICGAYGRVKSEFLKWLKSDLKERKTTALLAQ